MNRRIHFASTYGNYRVFPSAHHLNPMARRYHSVRCPTHEWDHFQIVAGIEFRYLQRHDEHEYEKHRGQVERLVHLKNTFGCNGTHARGRDTGRSRQRW